MNTPAASFRPAPVARLLRLAAAATLAGTLAAAAGCYTTSGAGLFKHTGDGFTYISTETLPVTISLVNVCDRGADHPDGTPFFIMEIPPGKQLTFNFLQGGGDDPVYTPDRMIYAVWDNGISTGTLDNQLTCPPASCRRIDVEIRRGPVWPEPDPAVRLRTDQAADRPPPQNGQGTPIPDAGKKQYDH